MGSNQTGFLEQFAEAGLKDSINIVSSNYGSGNQQIAISAEAGEGLVASQGYFMQVEGDANAEFVDLWTNEYGSETPIVSVAVDVWNAVHIWALAVERAGSAEPDATIDALQTEISFEAPNGLVTMDGGSHHLRQNIYIAIGDDNQGFEILETFQDVIPNFERERCNLIDSPEMVEHFTP